MVQPINNIAMNMSPANFSSEVIELKKKQLSELQAHYKNIYPDAGAGVVFNDVLALEREIKKLENSRKRQIATEEKKEKQNLKKMKKQAKDEEEEKERELLKKAREGTLYPRWCSVSEELPTEPFDLQFLLQTFQESLKNTGEPLGEIKANEACKYYYSYYYKISDSDQYMVYNPRTYEFNLVPYSGIKPTHERIKFAGRYLLHYMLNSMPEYTVEVLDEDPRRLIKTSESTGIINDSIRYKMDEFDKLPITLDKENFEIKLSFLRQYILKCLCSGNEKAEVYILKWIANLMKGRKNKTLLILTGAEGTGKSTLKSLICNMMPRDLCVPAAKTDNMLGNFNEIFDGKFFVCFEEIAAFTNANLFTKIEDSMKSYTTDDTIVINAKYQKERVQKNLMSLMICTNNKNAIKHQGSGRRPMCLDINAEYSRPKYASMWEELYRECINCKEFAIAFRRWLLDYMYDPEWKYQDIPITDVKKNSSIDERLNTNPVAYWLATDLNGVDITSDNLRNYFERLHDIENEYSTGEPTKKENDIVYLKIEYFQSDKISIARKDREHLIYGPMFYQLFKKWADLKLGRDRLKKHQTAFSFYKELEEFGFKTEERSKTKVIHELKWPVIKDKLDLLRMYVD